MIKSLKAVNQPSVLALNKVDLVRRDRLLAMSTALNDGMDFRATFMISALTGDGVDDLRRFLAGAVPSGPWLFPEDEITDMPMRLMAAELVREKLILWSHQELPYATTVETKGWQRFDDGSVRISLVIYVQREGQKAIVLGRGGQMIKRIGSAGPAGAGGNHGPAGPSEPVRQGARALAG